MPERTPRTEKDKQAISAGLKGKPKSPEHRAALSAAKKGKFTDAQRASTAATHARWKEEGYPTAGIPKSPEAIEKMSLSRTGHFTEVQQAARDATVAKWKTEGYWPTNGMVHSEEAKRVMAEKAFTRLPSRLVKHGITKEEYASQKLSGNRWCWFGKHFSPAGEFGVKTLGSCNGCRQSAYRELDLRKKYGVTPEWYKATLAEQGGGCAICGRTETHTVRTRNLMIDHDHDSGNVRGILCASCNTAIERIESVPNWTALAQAYLDKYKCSTTIQTAI